MKMLNTRSTDTGGFTLLEVLVAMGILMMIVLMMSTLFHQSNMAWQNGMRQAEMSIQARSALSLMRRDLAQAVKDDRFECNFSSSGFDVYVLGRAENGVRTVEWVKYSLGGKEIMRASESLSPGANYGSSFGDPPAPLLGSVSGFDLKYPLGSSSTNLPAWVDISITLEKKSSGAAGINVWSLGRKNSDSQKRIEKAKKNKLHTGDGSWL